MMPSDNHEMELLPLFTLGAESSFAIVKTTGETRDAFSAVVKEMNIDIDKGPYKILQEATDLIDEAIAEGLVPPEEKERLLDCTRTAYFRIFVSF